MGESIIGMGTLYIINDIITSAYERGGEREINILPPGFYVTNSVKERLTKGKIVISGQNE